MSNDNHFESQSKFMLHIFETVILKHPDKLDEICEKLPNVELGDVREKGSNAKIYYKGGKRVLDVGGRIVSIGSGMNAGDKAKLTLRLLGICNEDHAAFEQVVEPASEVPAHDTGTVPAGIDTIHDHRELSTSQIGKEKVLIIKSAATGKDFLKYLLQHEKSLNNYKTMSLSQIAAELTFNKRIQNAIEILDPSRAKFMVYKIMEGLTENKYFKAEELTFEAAEEVYKTILELRLEGVATLDTLEHHKARELLKIRDQYIEKLKTEKLWDKYDLLAQAIEVLTDHNLLNPFKNSCFATLSNAERSKTEKCLFDSLVAASQIPSETLTMPTYDLSDKKIVFQDATLQFVKAYGMTNEVKFVFKDMISNAYAPDTVQIVYTNRDYVEEIGNAAQLFDIPVSVNFDLKKSKYYFSLLEFINYVMNGLRIQDLSHLIAHKIIDLSIVAEEKTSISGPKFENVLKDIKVSRGIVRTITKLENFIKVEKEKAEKEKADKEKATQENDNKEISDDFTNKNRIIEAELLKAFFEKIKDLDISHNKTLSVHGFIEILNKVFQENITINNGKHSKNNAIARQVITAELNIFSEYFGEDKLFDGGVLNVKLLQMIRSAIESTDVSNSTASESGSVHAIHYLGAGVLCRAKIYVLGMDSAHFPGISTESSILSDLERKTIDANLSLKKNEADKTKKLCELLGTAKGEITLLYSYFDTVNVKERNPSVLMHRLVRASEKAIDSLETCGFMPYKDSARTPLERALVLQKTPCENQPPEADVDFKNFAESEIQISASSIEVMATCPKKYYYQHVLRIKPKLYEENYYQWLTAADKGTLVHGILEDYVKETFVGKTTDSIFKAPVEGVVTAIIDKKIKEEKEKNIPIFNYHVDAEVESIKKIIYLAVEDMYKEIEEGWVPQEPEKELKNIPLAIDLSGNIVENEKKTADDPLIPFTISKGFIDRMDVKKADGDDNKPIYRILDYKTGNSKNFLKKVRFQDILYSAALKKSTPQNEAEAAVFKFLNEDSIENFDKKAIEESFNKLCISEGLVDDSNTGDFTRQEFLYQLLKDIKERRFSPTQNKGNCKYCDFKSICIKEVEEVDEDDESKEKTDE